MILAASLGGILFGLAAPASAPPYPHQGDALQTPRLSPQFAPPLDRPQTYHVTTRRVGRDGSLTAFTLEYSLQWQRAGRGYRLAATLQRIDSDASPTIVRMLTAVLRSLTGKTVDYLVAPDGSRIDMVDPDGLWDSATERGEAVAAAADQAEAQQLARIVDALSVAERDRLASADIRALVAAANADIPVPSGAALSDGASISVGRDGPFQTIAKVEHTRLRTNDGADQSLRIDMLWTIDTASGLVVREQRQSWIIDPDSDAATLVEERVRALLPLDR